MEKEGIIRLRILDQPMHGPQDVSLRRLAHGVLLVIRQQHHVLARVAKVLVQIRRHVLDIVDTTTQLTLLPEIVDSNQQGLALTGAPRVLETVSLRSPVSERDRISGWWWWTTLVAVRVGVLILVHACVADVSGRILTLSKADASLPAPNAITYQAVFHRTPRYQSVVAAGRIPTAVAAYKVSHTCNISQ